MSAVLNGKKKHHRGYTFKYENEVVSNIHDNPKLSDKDQSNEEE